METEILSYDWHGINRAGERLLTFAKKSPQDGGGYSLDIPERDRYGYLFAAAPALYAAALAVANALPANSVGADTLRAALARADGNV